MAEETNPYLNMSKAERARQAQLLKYAEEAEGAALDVVAAAALKWSLSRLKERGKLGTMFDSIAVQALPKETNMGKAADLSETQIENIKRSVYLALEKAAG